MGESHGIHTPQGSKFALLFTCYMSGLYVWFLKSGYWVEKSWSHWPFLCQTVVLWLTKDRECVLLFLNTGNMLQGFDLVKTYMMNGFLSIMSINIHNAILPQSLGWQIISALFYPFFSYYAFWSCLTI